MIAKCGLCGREKELTFHHYIPKTLHKNKLFVKMYKKEYMKSHHWQLTTKIPTGAFPNTVEFLPYFADVEEDLPGSIKLEPKTFHNCQLMREKHNGYLQFYHKPTDQVLRIAMNSNIYHPL